MCSSSTAAPASTSSLDDASPAAMKTTIGRSRLPPAASVPATCAASASP
jgi:hypothetical protein